MLNPKWLQLEATIIMSADSPFMIALNIVIAKAGIAITDAAPFMIALNAGITEAEAVITGLNILIS